MNNLYEIGPDLFEVHSSRPTAVYKGTQLQTLVYCVQVLKVDPEQLQFAMIDMIQKDHNSADFGILGTFLYSFNRYEKKAS
jgi:hypothetical protein